MSFLTLKSLDETNIQQHFMTLTIMFPHMFLCYLFDTKTSMANIQKDVQAFLHGDVYHTCDFTHDLANTMRLAVSYASIPYCGIQNLFGNVDCMLWQSRQARHLESVTLAIDARP